MISNIRFRLDGDKVVLQVLFENHRNHYEYEREPEWRDAKVEDLIDVVEFMHVRFERPIPPAYRVGSVDVNS